MKILILSDIHANLTALQAVLESAPSFDQVWCLGDIVGYGPDPNECIQIIQKLPHLTCLAGNHDLAATGEISTLHFNYTAQKSVLWTQSTLTPENMLFLKGLQPLQMLPQAALVHGSLQDPVWEYIIDRFSAKMAFEPLNTPYCFCGHSHYPLFFQQEENDHITYQLIKGNQTCKASEKIIFNPGSVGQPRDKNPQSSFAIFCPEEQTIALHRINYNISAVQKRIIDAGLPVSLAERLSLGA